MNDTTKMHSSTASILEVYEQEWLEIIAEEEDVLAKDDIDVREAEDQCIVPDLSTTYHDFLYSNLKHRRSTYSHRSSHSSSSQYSRRSTSVSSVFSDTRTDTTLNSSHFSRDSSSSSLRHSHSVRRIAPGLKLAIPEEPTPFDERTRRVPRDDYNSSASPSPTSRSSSNSNNSSAVNLPIERIRISTSPPKVSERPFPSGSGSGSAHFPLPSSRQQIWLQSKQTSSIENQTSNSSSTTARRRRTLRTPLPAISISAKEISELHGSEPSPVKTPTSPAPWSKFNAGLVVYGSAISGPTPGPEPPHIVGSIRYEKVQIEMQTARVAHIPAPQAFRIERDVTTITKQTQLKEQPHNFSRINRGSDPSLTPKLYNGRLDAFKDVGLNIHTHQQLTPAPLRITPRIVDTSRDVRPMTEVKGPPRVFGDLSEIGAYRPVGKTARAY